MTHANFNSTMNRMARDLNSPTEEARARLRRCEELLEANDGRKRLSLFNLLLASNRSVTISATKSSQWGEV
jgi:hypothetical protein